LNQVDIPKLLTALWYVIPIAKADPLHALYLADRLHLGMFGRTITGDTYQATSDGVEGIAARALFVSTKLLCDMNEFSDSDIECLDAACKREYVKDDAWAAGMGRLDRVILLEDIVGTIPDSKNLLAYLEDPYP
jgi:hypothetical protein